MSSEDQTLPGGSSSLDGVMSDLVREAETWSRYASSTRTDMTQDSAIDSPSGLSPRELCLEQLARAISAHVTDILMERLGIDDATPRRQQQQQTAEQLAAANDASAVPPVPIPPKPSRLRAPQRRSQPASPATSRRQMKEPEPEQLSSGMGARYHSENRLDRLVPSPRVNETPLENRASRLRKAQTEKRRQSGTRSGMQTPLSSRSRQASVESLHSQRRDFF